MNKNYYDEVGRYINGIQREFVKKSTGSFEKGSFTIPQMMLMDMLFREKISTMSRIAKGMGISMSAATGLCDRLVRSRFITRERGKKDRRIVLITLTRNGTNIISEILNKKRELIKKGFCHLNLKERKTYLSLIKKIYNGVTGKG